MCNETVKAQTLNLKNKNSYKHLKDIQTSLSQLSENLEKQYYEMRKECMEEFSEDKKKCVIQENEMFSLYKKLLNNDIMRMTWIKNKMPWYITSFFKISSKEIRLIDNNIYIGVTFGKSQKTECFVQITPKDIGW